jgi:hypothetical protein
MMGVKTAVCKTMNALVRKDFKIIPQPIFIKFVTDFPLFFERELTPSLLLDILNLAPDDASVNQTYPWPIRYQHWNSTGILSTTNNTWSNDLHMLRRILAVPWLVGMLRHAYELPQQSSERIKNLIMFCAVSNYFDMESTNKYGLVIPLILTKEYRAYVAVHARLNWLMIDMKIEGRSLIEYKKLFQKITHSMLEIKKLNGLSEAQKTQCNDIAQYHRFLMVDAMVMCIYKHNDLLPLDMTRLPANTSMVSVIYDLASMPEIWIVKETIHGNHLISLTTFVYSSTVSSRDVRSKPISGRLELIFKPEPTQLEESITVIRQQSKIVQYLQDHGTVDNRIITKHKRTHA